MDSLDEALFRVGVENFLAFIENTQNVSGGRAGASNREPSVILMSRTEAAELIRLSFTDAEIPLAIVRLSFFDRTNSQRYISSYLDRRFGETGDAVYNVHRASPQPFARLRDDRLTQMIQVIYRNPSASLADDWEKTRAFVGYAPVLTALAESLAVANPAAERANLASAKSESERVLLAEIIDRIVTREHLKFSGQIYPVLTTNLPASSLDSVEPDSLYLVLEQAIRLLSHVDKNALVSPPPTKLPRELREHYEGSAYQFMTNHPFIQGRHFTNTVFEDYTRALTVTSMESAAALQSRPERYLEQVGPFFTEFLRSFLTEAEAIPEALAEYVIRSWNQSREVLRQKTQVTLQLISGNSWLTLKALDSDELLATEERTLDFPVSDLSGALHLKGNLRNITVISDGGIILGSTKEPLMLGPNVLVAASEIDVQSEQVTVGWRYGEYGESGVVLASESLAADKLSHLDGDLASFGLFCGSVPPRLQPYKRTLSSGAVHIPFADYIDLRAILTNFRSTIHMGLSTSKVRLANQVIKNSPQRQIVLNYLITCGVVSESGTWYRLEPAGLSSAGFSLNDLKDGEPSHEVLHFLAACRNSWSGSQ